MGFVVNLILFLAMNEPVLVSGTRTGSRAVATANMSGYCTGTRARA